MRRRPTRILLVLLAVLATLPVAGAALATQARRAADVDMAGVRLGSLERAARAGATLPFRADMLGVSWRGSATELELRVQEPGGRWSGWVDVHASTDAPDERSGEARRARRSGAAGRTFSNPLWVGAARRVQVRRHGAGTLRDLRVDAINATGTATRGERTATGLRSRASWLLGEQAQAQPYAPGIRSRSMWKAAKPKATPAYADSVLGVVIHHTDGTNRYSCSQVPAILRGIQRFHMRSQGWNDIGYNYLVDRCGGVWEGRAGGMTEPVIGAHTGGFNTSTAGIALIGDHTAVRPTTKAYSALRRLVAWRMDVAHVAPTGKMALTARSSDRFRVGQRVIARAVSGHRDLFRTSCPGAVSYSLLGRVARDAWVTGGAKVANISTGYALRSPSDPLDATVSRITARSVASHRDMFSTIRIERISTGEPVRWFGRRGRVANVAWSLPEGLQVPAWDLRVVINAARSSNRQRARAASVPLLRVPEDPGFVVTTPPPSAVVLGGDPADDAVSMQYTLGADYRVGAWLHDPATGAELATLRAPAYVGPTDTPRELRLTLPADVAAGTYELRVGLPADPAAGRSIRRFALAVTRS